MYDHHKARQNDIQDQLDPMIQAAPGKHLNEVSRADLELYVKLQWSLISSLKAQIVDMQSPARRWFDLCDQVAAHFQAKGDYREPCELTTPY